MSDKELCEIAVNIQKNAYAPYSEFRVGAALLCKDGSVYTGVNIENASFGATICAERCAIFKAVSDGKKDFVKIAITSSSNDFTMPCGMCRQVMSEFMEDGAVIVTNGKEIKSFKVSELLPGSFSFKKE
ncbi:MAG: cytidine deaminase [Lachnospiraceae bacterium]|nr:cytidine deaminase [Lachnospiraceae bacterium]